MTATRLVGSVRPLGGPLVLALGLLWFALLRPSGILGGTTGYVQVVGRSMLPTYHGGDLVVALPAAAYAVGDVIVYTVPAGTPGAGGRVIHRIVGGSEAEGWVTRGDNNSWDDLWRPTAADILGRAVLALPGAGLLLGYLRTPAVIAAVFAVLIVGLIELPPSRGRRFGAVGEGADASSSP